MFLHIVLMYAQQMVSRLFIIVLDSFVSALRSRCYACKVIVILKEFLNADNLLLAFVWSNVTGIRQSISWLSYRCWEVKVRYWTSGMTKRKTLLSIKTLVKANLVSLELWVKYLIQIVWKNDILWFSRRNWQVTPKWLRVWISEYELSP